MKEFKAPAVDAPNDEWGYFGDYQDLMEAGDYGSESEDSDDDKPINLREITFKMPDTFETEMDYLEKIREMMFLEHHDTERKRLDYVEQEDDRPFEYNGKRKFLTYKTKWRHRENLQIKMTEIKEDEKKLKYIVKDKFDDRVTVRTNLFFVLPEDLDRVFGAVSEFFGFDPHYRKGNQIAINSYIQAFSFYPPKRKRALQDSDDEAIYESNRDSPGVLIPKPKFD